MIRRGFTLIEVLVVIAIIIILAGILLPVMEQASKKSESVTCLSNVRSLILAAMIYGDDWDGYLPPALVPAAAGASTCWDRTLDPYLRNSAMYVCISDPTPTPGPSFTQSFRHSYGINLALTLVGGYQAASLRWADLREPAVQVLFFDLNQPYSYGWQSTWGNANQYVAERHLGE